MIDRNPDGSPFDMSNLPETIRWVERDGERVLQAFGWDYDTKEFRWQDVPIEAEGK